MAAGDPVTGGAGRELRADPLDAAGRLRRRHLPAYASGSHEYVAVESGQLRLTVGETAITLEAGDSAYFAADVPHGYANLSDAPCSYYVAALIMRPRR